MQSDKANELQIILDMDGVLANFSDAACEVHGRPGYVVDRWNFFEPWGISVDHFWAKIHALGDEFYGSMVKPYPWTEQLLKLVKSYGPVVIMSSPSNHPCGYAAKKIWCDKYAPGVRLIVGSDKHLLAGPNRVLIDDYEKNTEKFAEHGGRTIVFPRPWNSAAPYSGNWAEVMEYMRERLAWEKWAANRSAAA